MRLVSLAAAALMVLAAASPAAGRGDKSEGPGDLIEIAKAFVADKNCAVARPMLADITAAADFNTLDSADRSLTWQMLGYCEEGEAAWKAFKQATAEADVTPYAWRMRFYYAVEYKDADDALIALNGAASLAATGVDVHDQSLLKLVAQLKAAGDTARLGKLFDLLDKHGWTAKDPAGRAGALWTDYVLMLLDKGDVANARRVGGRIVQVGEVLAVRLDKRFAPLMEGDGAKAFDVVRAAEAELAGKRRRLAENPGDPDRVADVAFSLKKLGRPAEGLALIDAWLTANNGGEGGGEGGPSIKWLLAARVDVLWALGRFDQAVAAERLAAVPDANHSNGIHIVSLAGALNGLGRDREALTLIKALIADPANGLDAWGMALAYTEQVCAAAALGPAARADLDAALALSAAHAADNDAARAQALICAGDLDAAAALYIARLKDPGRRAAALIALSPLQRPPEPRADAAIRARQAQVAARPDVRAAIAAVGRTEPIPLAAGVGSF